MAEDQPPPPADPPPRRPLPSVEMLAKMSHSELRKMTPDEQRVVMHERTKNVETTVGELADGVSGLRGEVHGFKEDVERKIADFRNEVLGRLGPLERRVLGLAGVAAVAAAVGGALVHEIFGAIAKALR